MLVPLESEIGSVYNVNMNDSRSKILACACDLYLREGIEGFSMRKLARELGVTAPSLYRHYDSKESLLIAVVEEAHRLFAQRLYRALRARTPHERMHRAGAEYIEFALNNPHLYEMLYVSPHMLGMEEFPERILDTCAATGQFWQDRVRECMEAGLLRRGDPEEVSMTMWAHAHGLVTIFLRGLLPVDREAFIHVFQASGGRLLQGLGGEKAGLWAMDPAAVPGDAVAV